MEGFVVYGCRWVGEETLDAEGKERDRGSDNCE